MMHFDRDWRLRAVDEDCARKLADRLRLHPVLARILVARGITAEDLVQRHLDPRLSDLVQPGSMAGLDQAVDRLGRAILSGEHIGVFGDYDVDGVSSTTLLGDYLRRCGARATLRVARRDEGYGFQASQAEQMRSFGCSVLFLVDCGTGDTAGVEAARNAGIDVLAVDHHRVARWDWPGVALVNPHRPDCGFPYKGLASVGLCFYLVASLRRYLEREHKVAPDPRAFLDLVALGTVADVAPLDGENRILVARGLHQLSATVRPGLKELLKICNLAGKVPTTEEVGWRLAPRLNAPGRMGDAQVALDCLYHLSPADGIRSARECDAMNERRKEIQTAVLEEAVRQARAQVEEGRAFLLVASDDWHPGVIGIVASKLADLFGRPAGVVALQGPRGRGSARGVPGIDLFATLSECSALLERFGGHRAAAGFSVAREQVEALRHRLHEVTAQVLPTVQVRCLDVDCVLDIDRVDLPLCQELRRLAPHGHSNSEPVFAATGVCVESARQVGADHLALVLRGGERVVPAIGFGMISRKPEVGQRVDVAYVAEIDDYVASAERVRLRLVDLRPAAALGPSTGPRK
jgi:single-stranded-DNA-specific exonuclease